MRYEEASSCLARVVIDGGKGINAGDGREGSARASLFMSTETIRTFAWPEWLRRVTDGIAAHGVPCAVVVGIHLLIGLALMAHHVAAEREPPPILVELLEAPQIREASPLPPAPRIELPALSPVLVPELSFASASPAIVVAAEPAPVPASMPSEPAPEPIVEARFDVDYLDNPQPAYPSISRRLREEGLVVLKVRVRADGTPDHVLVHRHSGFERLDAAALAAVKRWKFLPAKRGDQSVDSWVLVPIEFELRA